MDTVAILAQEATTQPCGEGADSNWLCELVLRETENELLARISGVGTTIISIILILVGAVVVSRLLRRGVNRVAARMEANLASRLERAVERGSVSDTQRFRTRRLQRLQAISGVLRGVMAVVVWLTAILMVVGEIGLPLQPLLAGAGLAGIVLGFGAQQLVRDILAGVAILIEDQYGVGDWIEVDDKFGLVERVGLRSTAFRDVDGNLHHVLNGYIQRVANLSQEWARATYDVPISLDADLVAAKELIHRVATELTTDPVWGPDSIGPVEIWGVQELGPQGVKIRVVIPTKPLRNWDLTRQLRERLKLAFDEAGIRMPSQLVDIGGMHSGYAVLTKDLPFDEPSRDSRRRSHLDGPPPSGLQAEQTDAAARDARDATDELRIEQGPRVRPD